MTTGPTAIAAEVTLFRGAAAPTAPLVAAIEAIAARAPFRHLATPNGGTMSVAMTNCGPWGWHSDARGYRYAERDPLTDAPWPAMPPLFMRLAQGLAERGGFAGFEPDACLVNRYAPGARMGAHRDWDELDKRHPIVSVSIGLPAVFLWHGATRRERPIATLVEDGDVIVWGGRARAGFHGVRKLADGLHPVSGALRYNLTFRRAK
ncbi:MAG: Alpha-ketoglutarate-dependent dioxygenase AlkB [Steroidobacteraceae bacterium]|nr:Alpha-ketoglutarate-dependent dioxygenase AlkB [Steroidobacteraceae bacterium]